MKNVLICIMGETGSGKSTIEKELVSSDLFLKIVSTTSRLKRAGEEDGIDYNFITDEVFEEKIKKGDFIEHVTYATKGTLGKNFSYGFDKSEADKLDKGPCVAVVTPHGYEQLRDYLGSDRVMPIYIKTNPDLRKENALKRHENEPDKYDKYKSEIERRFEADKEVFAGVEDLEGILILENNYDRESFINNLKKIVEVVFYINNRNEVELNYNANIEGV